MAWYTSHSLYFRGRLLEVGSRYGGFNGARIVKGKPLDLRKGSRDYPRLVSLFYRSKRIQREIEDMREGINYMAELQSF